MSDSQWTDYFIVETMDEEPQPHVTKSKTAAKTLWDLPTEDAKAEAEEEETPAKSKKTKSLLDIPTEDAPKEEVQPAEVETAPLSIFEVDPSDKAVLEAEKQKAPEPKEAPKKPQQVESPDEAKLWEQFLLETFGPKGGKTLVPNTNFETKEKYPKVQVNTLLKSDTGFHQSTMAKYEAWKQKQKQEETPQPEKPLTPEEQAKKWEAAKNQAVQKAQKEWPGTSPNLIDWNDPQFQKMEEQAKKGKIQLIKWMRDNEDSPWAPIPIDALPPGAQDPFDHKLSLSAAKYLGESYLDHLEKKKTPGLKPPTEISEIDWDDPQWGGVVQTAKDLGDKKIQLIKWIRSDVGSPWHQSKTGFLLGLKEAKALAESLQKHLGTAWKPPPAKPEEPKEPEIDFDDPHTQKSLDKIADFVKEQAAAPWKTSSQLVWTTKWLMDNQDAFDVKDLAHAKMLAHKLLNHAYLADKLKKPKPEVTFKHFPDLPKSVGETVNQALFKARQDFDGSMVSLLKGLSHVKDALGEYAEKFDYVEAALQNMIDVFEGSQAAEDGNLADLLKKQLAKHQATKPGAPPLEELTLPEKKEEPKSESKPKKKKKSPHAKYDEVTDKGQLEVGDVVVYTSGNKTYKAVVLETWPSGAVKIQKIHSKSGNPWGKKVYIQGYNVVEHIDKKYTHETIPLHFQDIPEVKQLLEGPPPGEEKAEAPKPHKPKPGQLSYAPPAGAPKPHKGKHVQLPHQVHVGDAVTWKIKDQEFYGRVTDTKDGNFYVQSMNPKTGEASKMYVFGQWDLNNLGVGKIDDKELPKKFKVAKVPPKPEPPAISPAPEKPISVGLHKVEGTPVTGPDDLKEGDYITWTNTNGDLRWGLVVDQNTYHGVPNWQVQQLNPETGAHAKDYLNNFYISGSTNKYQSHNPHKLSAAQVAQRMEAIEEQKKALKEWEPKYKEWQQEKLQAEKEYQEQLKEWEAEKAAVEGTTAHAVSPIKKTSVSNLSMGDKANWNLNSHLIRLSDDYVPQIYSQNEDWLNGQELEKHIQTRMQNYDPTKNIPTASSTGGSAGLAVGKKIWDERSEGEKKLLLGAPWLAEHFQNEILTPEERNVLQQHVSSWQGSAQAQQAVALKGLVDSAIPAYHKGKKPTGENAQVLERALAKAMAWSQVLFDHFGVDKLSLFRGAGSSGTTSQNLSPGDQVVAEKSGGGKGARSLTGFSSSPYVANGFGSGLTYTRVPAAHALVTPFHFLSLGGQSFSPKNPDSEWEAEYFIGGIQDLPWKYAGPSGSLGKWDFNKMKIASSQASETAEGYLQTMVKKALSEQETFQLVKKAMLDQGLLPATP